MKKKKAQEEMVGFVLIIVLVSIIALVFLGISLRKKTPVESNFEIEDFLQAAVKITTDCSINYEPINLGDLIKSCLEGKTCLDEKDSCEVLDEILSKIMDDSWPVGENHPRSCYKLIIKKGEEVEKELIKGKCEGGAIGGWVNIYYPGEDIEISLEIYTRN